MSRKQLLLVAWLLLGLMAVGCEPQAEVVEVTRNRTEEVTVPVEVEVEVTRLVTITTEAAEPEVIEVTRIVTEAIERIPLGTAENPVQLLIAPFMDRQITEFRAQTLADDLADVTALEIDLVVAESFGEVVAALCDRPDQTIALLPGPLAYLAQQECQAQPEYVARKNGVPYTTGMLLVRTDQGIFELEDLNGLTWGIPSENSWDSYLYFQALLADQGITPGEISVTNGNSNTMLAVYNEEVEFATASFLPPLLPFLEEWQYGEDDPEIWRTLGLTPYRHPRGFIVVLALAENGGYQIRDSRAAIFDVERDVFAFTTILTLGGRFPNESIVFGSDVPIAVARTLGNSIEEYVASEACQQSVCSGDFYIWSGLDKVSTETYADVAFTIENLKMDASDLVARYDN